MRTLILFRHAKAEPLQPNINDIDRPLRPAGRKAAERMGEWFRERTMPIDRVICSPAVRAQSTLAVIKPYITLPEKNIVINDDLYLASFEQLLAILSTTPKKSKNVMLVGHNPGLEDLLTYLCGEYLPRNRNGKLLPTAALARIQLPDDWHKLAQGDGELLDLIRPKELD